MDSISTLNSDKNKSKVFLFNLGSITFSNPNEYKDINLSTTTNKQVNQPNIKDFREVDVLGLDAWTDGTACVSVWQYGNSEIYLTCDRAVTITNFRLRLRGYY